MASEMSPVAAVGGLAIAPIIGAGSGLAFHAINTSVQERPLGPIVREGALKWSKWGALTFAAMGLGIGLIGSENDAAKVAGGAALGTGAGMLAALGWHGFLHSAGTTGEIYAMGHHKFGKWGGIGGAVLGAGIAAMAVGSATKNV